ncbi:outer membrane lipoprotein carrier protein [Salegentibacter sp. 24]|uniref:LolA family protein n=1 Tax=Salegentibacter sp. 24 TaxID=2183986 RepID=UPI00105C9557|nr:outer membrane lipoprotein carrier protein LolA [Salegentibacter sp. 24]TDN89426.1 outer membrane lipoprotein carrier protein [Salegentibacter sp. 24]
MRILNIFLLLLSLNLAAQKKLSKEEVLKFQEEMITSTNNLETLETDFIQIKQIEMMKEESVSRGKLYYQNPEKLKWEYTEPLEYIILYLEGDLHINDSGDKIVRNTSSNKLFDKIAKLITGSVNGKLLQNNQDFEISYTQENNLISALIVPKDKSLKAIFSEIYLLYNESNIVEKVSLKEESGDATIIEFSNIKINQNIPDTIFKP